MKEFLENLEKSLISFETGSKELNQFLQNFVSAKGKKIRPKLAYLCIKANNQNISSKQLKLISAGELLHAASLIHDDIIDDATYRRGMEVLHKLYNHKIAVITGDFLASIALEKIQKLENFEIQTMFLNTFNKMCKAELSQYFERGNYPSIENYLEKSTNKTAELFGTILKGVMLLNSKEISDKAYTLGLHYGRAFQIKNDLEAFLTTNSEDKTNKTYTAPDIFINQGLNKISAIEKTKDLIDNEKKLAISTLTIFADNQYKHELRALIEGL